MSALKVGALRSPSASSNNIVLNADGTISSGGGGVIPSNTYITGTFSSNTYVQETLGNAGLPSGTKLLFQQTAAPTGWTKDTTHNDKALRVVSGTASNGGIDSFSTTFGAGKTTASHTLSTPQIASHSHIVPNFKRRTGNTGAYTGYQTLSNSTNMNDQSTASTGGSQAHSHNLSLDIAYVDTIIATKD